MNIRLSLFTIFMVMCNTIIAETIDDILAREHYITKAVMTAVKKNNGDIKPYIMKEIAVVGIYRCMENERTLDELDDFSRCFERASLLNGRMRNEQDNELYANALKEIKSLVTTN